MREKLSIGLLLLLLFCCTGSRAVAQTNDPVEEVGKRAKALIEATMQNVSERAHIFNEQISLVNSLRALEVSNLDSAHVARNLPVIEDFLSYLMRYRDSSTILLKTLQDSLGYMREELPQSLKGRYLKAFEEAYLADVRAFDNYTLSLSTLFGKVTDVLTLLQTSKYTIQKNQLQFASKKDLEKYKKLFKEIDQANKRAAKAGDASKKATAWSNKTIKEVYGN